MHYLTNTATSRCWLHALYLDQSIGLLHPDNVFPFIVLLRCTHTLSLTGHLHTDTSLLYYIISNSRDRPEILGGVIKGWITGLTIVLKVKEPLQILQYYPVRFPLKNSVTHTHTQGTYTRVPLSLSFFSKYQWKNFDSDLHPRTPVFPHRTAC